MNHAIEVLPAEPETQARPTHLDACRDTFAAEIAGAIVARQGLPEAGAERNMADRIYAFANECLAARARLEVAEAEHEANLRARAMVRQNAPQAPGGVRR